MQKNHLDPALEKKWNQLLELLSGFSSAVIAYSGGVDSSFLAYAGYQVMRDEMIAITVITSLEKEEIVKNASTYASQCGFRHITLPANPLKSLEFSANPVDRCYLCKKMLLEVLWEYANRFHIETVLEGQNLDDENDYRPGRKAVDESRTRSPLLEVGLTKSDIRLLAKAFGLPFWSQPSSPCLASRIPYGTKITLEAIRRIESAESFLYSLGFSVVRVRHYQDMARIEVEPEKLDELLGNRDKIIQYFGSIGYKCVSLDLQGYRLGSLNEGLIK